MNKKGNVEIIVILVVAVIVGLVGLKIFQAIIFPATNTQAFTDTANLTNGSTTFLTHSPIFNLVVSHGGITLGNGNFTADTTLGTLTPNATSKPASLFVNASYDWNAPTYQSNGSTRLVIGLILVLFALFILVMVAMAIKGP